MFDPREPIRDLVLTYLRSALLPDEPLSSNYIAEIVVRYHETTSTSETIVAEVIADDDGPSATLYVIFEPDFLVRFAAYTYDGETRLIPEELY